MKDLTIIMYHYVRDIKGSRYPGIKGLETRLFKEQVKFLKRNYNPVTMQMVIDAFNGGEHLPPKSCLLTFDDAYIDHYVNAFPILYDNNVQGCFYAPVRAVTEHKVLDVNKIHFILEQCHDKLENHRLVIGELKNGLDEFRSEYNLLPFDYYYDKLAIANRFDTKEVIFIKRLLQVELDESLRGMLTDRLFEKYVLRGEIDEESFSRELYMSVDQMRTMVKCGMHIGSHGYNHYWLGHLSDEKQDLEIGKSVDFIRSIGADVENWTICYPYGNYNEYTLKVLKANGCKLGFTTEVDIADSTARHDAIYKLPRLDTNDLPKEAGAEVNDWWEKTI